MSIQTAGLGSRACRVALRLCVCVRGLREPEPGWIQALPLPLVSVEGVRVSSQSSFVETSNISIWHNAEAFCQPVDLTKLALSVACHCEAETIHPRQVLKRDTTDTDLDVRELGLDPLSEQVLVCHANPQYSAASSSEPLVPGLISMRDGIRLPQ